MQTPHCNNLYAQYAQSLPQVKIALCQLGKCLYCLKFLIVFISFPGDFFIMLFTFLYMHLMHKAGLRSEQSVHTHCQCYYIFHSIQ